MIFSLMKMTGIFITGLHKNHHRHPTRQLKGVVPRSLPLRLEGKNWADPKQTSGERVLQEVVNGLRLWVHLKRLTGQYP